MFLIREFFFRKMDLYTVIVYCVVLASVFHTLKLQQSVMQTALYHTGMCNRLSEDETSDLKHVEDTRN